MALVYISIKRGEWTRYKTYLRKGKSYETSYENIVSWSQTLCLPSLGVCFSAQMTENRNYDWASDNEHDSVKELRENGQKKQQQQKNVTLPWKDAWKSCFTTHTLSFHLILKDPPSVPKTFPTKIKPAKCPAKENVIWGNKEKAKSILKILLSAHARTS